MSVYLEFLLQCVIAMVVSTNDSNDKTGLAKIIKHTNEDRIRLLTIPEENDFQETIDIPKATEALV